jgi:signal transduction histidine kinase/CheY-like chemotaxis protein/HPt (histidine-containing phosphotransfer) domain-containing protein
VRHHARALAPALLLLAGAPSAALAAPPSATHLPAQLSAASAAAMLQPWAQPSPEESDGTGTVLSAATRDYVILGTILLAVLAAGLADVRTRRRRRGADGGRALALAREEVAVRTKQVDELREELRATCALLDDAVRASESKTRFIGHVSHEFRTPLSSIIGFASLLAAEHARLPAEKRAEYLEIVLRNARHLLHVINDILNLSKVEAGTLEVTPAPVYLPEAVSAVVASLAPLAHERGIQVRVRDEGRHFAVADSGRLRQVLQNLLENAIKYAPEGTPVDVEVTSADGEVRVDVRDHGPGITPEDQGRLFKEFSRLNRPGERVAGAGLGLALSKQLVELMGGRIGVDSEMGRGSDFWLALPAGEETFAPTAAARAPSAPTGPRRGTVAVVDDDADIRAFTAVVLEGAGYTVLLDDGHTGTAQRLCGDAPDVILLDLHLEGRGGYEALAELRACEPLDGVPVIAFTASGTPADLARMRAADFDGQLLKPVEPDTLLRCVDGALASAAARRASGASTRVRQPDEGAPRGGDDASPASSEPASPPPSPPGDAEDADDGDDYLAPLRARFRAGLPARLAEMDAATASGDVAALTREVHKLRGAAAGYGMAALSDRAAEAEEALRGGGAPDGPPVAAFLAMLRATIAEGSGP